MRKRLLTFTQPLRGSAGGRGDDGSAQAAAFKLLELQAEEMAAQVAGLGQVPRALPLSVLSLSHSLSVCLPACLPACLSVCLSQVVGLGQDVRGLGASTAQVSIELMSYV